MQNMIKSMQNFKGVGMSETKKMSIVLKAETLAILNRFVEQHNLKNASEAIEALTAKFQQEEKRRKEKKREREKWEKAFELASKDEELLNLWETDEDIRGLY